MQRPRLAQSAVRCLLIALTFVTRAAQAHDADLIYARLHPGSGELVETVTLTVFTLSQLAPLDADGDGAVSQSDLTARKKAIEAGVWDEMPLSAGGVKCALFRSEAMMREGFIELEARFTCGQGELRQDFRILRVLPANYRVALGSQLEGERAATAFAQMPSTSVTLPRPGSGDGFRRGFELGMTQISASWVLAAIAAVLLAAGSWTVALRSLGVLAVGLCGGAFLPGPDLAATALLVIFAWGATVKPPPIILSLLTGAAAGLVLEAPTITTGVGSIVSALCLVVPFALITVAIGKILRRRAVWKVARWVAPVLATLFAVMHGFAAI